MATTNTNSWSSKEKEEGEKENKVNNTLWVQRFSFKWWKL